MSTSGAQPTRPLPRLSEPDTRAFWEATSSGRLTYQVCRRCGGVVFYPRRHCTHCTSTDLEERTSAGRGTVYTYTVIRQHGQPFFRGRTPYVLAFVDVDEGFRLLSEITGAAPEEVHVGQRVTLTWEDHEEVRVPLFRPDGP
ncbi:MAG TPA: Zn-ribbon domain-containing OB-fold protein [Candidatus Dormibacteraeota bacterium]|nr:Zn-ribbon domain-containing OB-fold protein [Candidatus Dormibacteraeota bacterium]